MDGAAGAAGLGEVPWGGPSGGSGQRGSGVPDPGEAQQPRRSVCAPGTPGEEECVHSSGDSKPVSQATCAKA